MGVIGGERRGGLKLDRLNAEGLERRRRRNTDASLASAKAKHSLAAFRSWLVLLELLIA